MKKLFMWVLAATLMCGTTTVFTSCDDDDVEDIMETINLVGKWKSTGQVTPKPTDNLEIDFNSTIEFKSDGTFSTTYSDNETATGTWTLRGKVLTMSYNISGVQTSQNFNIQEGWSRDRMVMTTVINDEDDNGKTITYNVSITMNRIK